MDLFVFNGRNTALRQETIIKCQHIHVPCSQMSEKKTEEWLTSLRNHVQILCGVIHGRPNEFVQLVYYKDVNLFI